MIGRLRAAQEVHRLRVTNYFATLDEDAVGELARMLTFADTETIVVAVVNQWLEEQTERPTPADLRRLVAEHNIARQQNAEPLVTTYKCVKCQESGICGGDMSGPDTRPWEWCDCPESWPIRSKSPLLVEEANKVRTRLLATARGIKSVPSAT